jgi:hypothetical protein
MRTERVFENYENKNGFIFVSDLEAICFEFRLFFLTDVCCPED